MKYLSLFLLALLFWGCRPKKDVKQYTIEQLYKNNNIGGAGFNANESQVLVSSNNTGIFNVYAIAVSDTSMKPLTRSAKDSYFAVGYVPGTDNFLYSADQGGNENRHIYLQKQGNAAVKDITPWTNSTNSIAGWSDDKKYVYISSNKRNPKFSDIYKLDTATWTPAMFYQNDSAYSVGAISHSERYIALTKAITDDNSELYLFDRQTKSLKKLSNNHEANWVPQAFDKDDAALFFTTNDGFEFSFLMTYDLKTGGARKIYGADWDVVDMNLSEHQRFYSVTINEDGKYKTQIFDHATGQPIVIPEIKDGNIKSAVFSPSEKNILLSVSSSRSPDNLYVYNFEHNTLKPITRTLNLFRRSMLTHWPQPKWYILNRSTGVKYRQFIISR